MERGEVIRGVAADLLNQGNPDKVTEYGRTAAERWMRQCREQAELTCLQDCADCPHWEEDENELSKMRE